MQVFEKAELKFFEKTEPIATYLGHQIFLNRVLIQGMDKGVWLHWCHPDDEGKTGLLKYGHFLSPGQTLQDALHQVESMIEATVELELLDVPVPTSDLGMNLSNLFKASHASHN